MTVHVSPTWRETPGRYLVTIRFAWPDGSKVRDRKEVEAKTEAEARRWGAARESELRAKGQPKPEDKTPKRESPTLASFVEKRWLPTYPVAASNGHTTIREKNSHLKVHILPALGALRLDQITREKLDLFVATMANRQKPGKDPKKKIGKKRIKNVLATLRKILVTAVDWNVLAFVPKFPKIKTDETDFDYFTRAESDLILGATRSPEERALLMFALHTGARAGEQLALQWSALDFVNGHVTIKRSSSDGIVTEKTKSGRVRRVPLTSTLIAALKGQRHLKGDLVFCRPDGTPYTLWQFHERLEGACRRAGLREIRWHDLRHSFASQLVMAGTPLRQVQEWMGHSTIMMTMRYSHLAPGGGREFLSVLDAPTTTAHAAVHS